MHPETRKRRMVADTEFVSQHGMFVAEGRTAQDSFEAIQRMGYSKSQATFYRHLKRFKETGKAHSDKKAPGMAPKLNTEQVADLRAWVVARNNANSPFNRVNVQKFVFDAGRSLAGDRDGRRL